MKKYILYSLFIFTSCNSTQAVDSELLKRENDIIKRENKLLEKEKVDIYKKAKSAANNALYVKNKNYRNNWYNYITVDPVYNSNPLGGITSASVSITNSMEYIISSITVTVSYVKDNGDVYKSVDFYQNDIAANSSFNYSLPSTSRGTKLEASITSIHSKGLHFCYEPGNWANNSDDPYFCK